MKKSLFGVVDLKPRLKCEQSVLVEYYITEEGEKYDGLKPYGIEVVKKQKIDGVVYREIKTVCNMSGNMREVEKLIGILHRNTVTPVTVGDVLEDLEKSAMLK